LSLSVNTTPFDTYYRWYVNNVLVNDGAYASSYCTCYYTVPDARQAGNNTIRVEVDTYCDANNEANGEFYYYCGKMRSAVSIFPNPSREIIRVILNRKHSNNTKSQARGKRSIDIRDHMG